MRSTLISALTLIALQALSGCAASPPLPKADGICLEIRGIADPQLSYVRRKVGSHLIGTGFQIGETSCDVKVTYTNFNSGEWEILNHSAFGSKSSSSWRVEGTLDLRQGATMVIQDEGVDIRDQSTELEMLDALAEEIFDLVADHYQPLVKR
jgi:hypothetical protein